MAVTDGGAVMKDVIVVEGVSVGPGGTVDPDMEVLVRVEPALG